MRARRATAVALLLSLVGGATAASVAAADDPPASNVLIAGFIGDRHAYGCGVIVAAGARTITIATARHVLEIQRPEFITVSGERLTLTSAAPVANHDVALLIAQRPRARFAIAIAAAPLPAGSRLRVWGPIKDMPFTQHAATMRDMDERVTDAPDNSIAIDCEACDHGDSGTGVYDEAGHLVGIITRGYFAGDRKLLVLVERIGPETIARVQPLP